MLAGSEDEEFCDDAGGSAEEQADLLGQAAEWTELQIIQLQQVLQELRQRGEAFRVGAAGERQVASSVQRVLVDLGSADWYLLADRRWPGTRRANIDLLLVGPPGIVVLDVKTWRDVRVEAGSLWHGQACADDQLDKVREQADAVCLAVADTGLAPAVVHGTIILAGRRLPPVDVHGIIVVGERSLSRFLVGLGSRLSTTDIDAVLATVEKSCPPMADSSTPARRVGSGSVPHSPPGLGGRAADTGAARQRLHPVASVSHRENHQLDLDVVDDVLAAAVDAAARGPIEAWMTWLHPDQALLATRALAGPARVRGASGTGKSVVALHRVRHLARRPDARVLVTSFVRTLPGVQQGLFQRLAPGLERRVEFRGIHAWALRYLRAHAPEPLPQIDSGATAFRQAWDEAGERLAGSGLPQAYWRDEVCFVIKGRGLTEPQQYLDLDRVGRRTPLQVEQRRAVWSLYRSYESALRMAGVWDWDDLLAHALAEVRRNAPQPAYTAVVIDEVQDLTLIGLQLAHALAGDGPDGLFLVGDGQQKIYPGGITLAEAGVSVVGRSTVLRRNYRNRQAILTRAAETLGDDRFDDLDTTDEDSADRFQPSRPGGKVAEVHARDRPSLVQALVHTIGWDLSNGSDAGDLAVLLSSNQQVRWWADQLRAAGVAVQLLTDYRGTPTPAVKVGTYQRAKGLEFEAVYLPDIPSEWHAEDATAEEAERLRRTLFVAMTRARDRLWLGHVTPAAHAAIVATSGPSVGMQESQ